VTTVDTNTPAPSRIKEIALGLAHAAMLHTVVRLGVADALGDEPAEVAQLARTVGADPDPLNRVLRGLTHLGVFDRTADGRYAHNDLSRLLRRDAPRSMADMVLWAGAAWAWQSWPRLETAVRTGEPVVPELFGKDFFTYLREDGGEDAQIFNRAMTQSSGFTSQAVVEAFDPGDAKSIVDIGGGQGHLLKALLQAHPDLHGVLFDLAPVVAVADPALRPGGELADRARLEPGDCLEGVPVEADVYVIKQVLKWDFDSSVRVLENIRRTARPGARIVVVQNLVDDTPEPRVAAAMDLLLLLNVGGREHTLDEFRQLFRRAGLEFAGVTRTRTPLRLIEATVPA